MSVKMNQWENNRIHCFLQNYVKNWVCLAHFVFGVGTSSQDLDLKQSSVVPDQTSVSESVSSLVHSIQV